MIFYILGIVVYLFVTVYPVMWSARKCGAPVNGFFPCLLAILIASLLTAFLSLGVNDQFFILLISIVVTTFSFKFILQSRFFASLIISLMSSSIYFVIYLVAGLFLGDSV